MKVSVRELKNHLSKYLQKVRMSVNIIITSHHVPLAKLLPIPQHADNTTQELS